MTLAEVKRLISAFNAAVRYKLENSQNGELATQFEAELRSVSLVGRAELPALASADGELDLAGTLGATLGTVLSVLSPVKTSAARRRFALKAVGCATFGRKFTEVSTVQ